MAKARIAESSHSLEVLSEDNLIPAYSQKVCDGNECLGCPDMSSSVNFKTAVVCSKLNLAW